jgi:arylsulfate sulfotransferase
MPSADPPTVTLSPTQNPLVAKYSVTSACMGQAMAEFGSDVSYGRSSAWYPVPGHSAPASFFVAGMRASSTYHMRVIFNCFGKLWDGPDQTFATGPLPSMPFPTLTVKRPNPLLSSGENPGVELVNIIAPGANAMQAFFTDRDANPIWYYDVGAAQGNFPYTFKLLPNGHMIFSVSRSISAGNILREVDLAGNTIREMSTADLAAKMQRGFKFAPTGFHHDLLPMSNGHVIILGNYYKNFTDLPGYPGTTRVLGDCLVDLDPDWNPVWAWSAFDYLDVNRYLAGLPDWTHANAVVYSPADGNLLLSMRNQAWILKIDYSNGAGTGTVLWKLGYQGDFALGSGDPEAWFYFQHFPSIITQNGTQTTLGIWDNGNDRVLDNDGDQCGTPNEPPCASRATVFEIDESTKVANLLWQDTPGPFGYWGGSENQLQNGNIEFDLNSPLPSPPPNVGSQVFEVTQTETPQVVWEMDVESLNAYRAYRVPSLYPGVAWEY